jgi:hypothetical protein
MSPCPFLESPYDKLDLALRFSYNEVHRKAGKLWSLVWSIVSKESSSAAP